MSAKTSCRPAFRATIEHMFESARLLGLRKSSRYCRPVVDTSAHAVAAELRRRRPGLGVEKQHKLLYYCQGHHLAAFGEPLFVETISAWDMGPVVGEVWYAERNGSAPSGDLAQLSEAQLNTIGYVISRYGALTGADLERLTHSETPWRDANRNRLPGTTAKIPLDALREFFVALQMDGDDNDTPQPDTDDVAAWLKTITGPPTDAPTLDSLDDLRARLVRG